MAFLTLSFKVDADIRYLRDVKCIRVYFTGVLLEDRQMIGTLRIQKKKKKNPLGEHHA